MLEVNKARTPFGSFLATLSYLPCKHSVDFLGQSFPTSYLLFHGIKYGLTLHPST